jgi:hypothetical protein
MRTLTFAVAAAVLIVGVNLSSAQNAPTTKVSPSPNSINKGSEPTSPSGAEATSAAAAGPSHIIGTGKYCSEQSSNHSLNCQFASISSCEKSTKANSLRCVENPNRATTGSK